tara:strand:+ start:150 stop:440 length:291 start_codon:yes stop_codon:yes gene_type:complete
MTLFYQTNSWGSQPQPTEDRTSLWKHIANKKNWRIVELINGYFQTEYQDENDFDRWHDVTRREDLKDAEEAIDQTVKHYAKKVEFLNGPKVVKTFK